jgi:hypothetical protein
VQLRFISARAGNTIGGATTSVPIGRPEGRRQARVSWTPPIAGVAKKQVMLRLRCGPQRWRTSRRSAKAGQRRIEDILNAAMSFAQV